MDNKDKSNKEGDNVKRRVVNFATQVALRWEERGAI